MNITLELIYEKLVGIEGRIVGIEGRLDRIEGRIDRIENTLAEHTQKLDEHDGYFAALSLQLIVMKNELRQREMDTTSR